ncbi:serine hydrolase domain-containing protein [Arthrobacter sp. AD-310]
MNLPTSYLRRMAAAAVVLLALAACTYDDPEPAPSPSSSTQGPTDALDRSMVAFMDQGAVAVITEIRWPGGTYSKAYGVRDLGTRVAAQPDDLVSVASVTKSMTAVSVLKLVEDGLIGLDDPVNGVVDSFTTVLQPPGPITVRQLLNHTSGMPEFQAANEKTSDDVPRLLGERLSVQRQLELTASLPWEARHVGSFRYSDSNYVVLGQLIEKLRGKPYPRVILEDIISPLGLESTFLEWDLRQDPKLVHGYVTYRGERFDVTGSPPETGSSAFGAVSNVPDVNDFFAGLFTGKLLSAASLREMTTTDPFPLYGLGLRRWSQGCDGDYRFGGRGGFWAYRTTALSSTDGKYQATMTLVPPPIPTSLEEPESENRLDLWDDQMESALQEALDRLCPN